MRNNCEICFILTSIQLVVASLQFGLLGLEILQTRSRRFVNLYFNINRNKIVEERAQLEFLRNRVIQNFP